MLTVIGALLVLTLTALAPAAVVSAWKVARWQGIVTAWIMLLVMILVYYGAYSIINMKGII